MPWGVGRETNLSRWQVSCLGKIVPEVGTLEDPDEGRLIHMGKKRKKWNCIISMPRREKCDYKTISNVETQLFETAACA